MSMTWQKSIQVKNIILFLNTYRKYFTKIAPLNLQSQLAFNVHIRFKYYIRTCLVIRK